MAPSVARAEAGREDNDLDGAGSRLGSGCHRGARAALKDVIDTSGVPRKALAGEVSNGDESLFSKQLGGTRAFDLGALDLLPRPLVVAWLKRYGDQVGVKVTDVEPAEVTERLLALVDELGTVARLAKILSGKPVKASLR